MSAGLFLRAAVVQLVAVAALSAVLGLALPHGFFEDWGWLVGPAAWLTCAALTALMLRLPTGPPCSAPRSPASPAPSPSSSASTGSEPPSPSSSSRSGARGCPGQGAAWTG